MCCIFGRLRKLFYVFNTGESLDQVLKQSVDQTPRTHSIPCCCKADKSKRRKETISLGY